jgi:hypothetical protein
LNPAARAAIFGAVRPILTLLLLLAPCLADTIAIDTSADAVVIRSPMSEGNFLMRLPAGFKETAAEEPWQKQVAREGCVVRVRIEKITPDQDSLGAAQLAAPRAKQLGDLKLEGQGGARRIGMGGGKGKTRLALFVRDGKRFYEVVVDFDPADPAAEKQLRDALDNFTLLDPKGAPEAAPENPETLKAQTLTHEFYKISLIKPAGFGERPPDVEGDKGIWKHFRRIDKDNNTCEIRVRSHLAVSSKLKPEELMAGTMKNFENKFNDTRIPKKPKTWRFRGAKEGYMVEMLGRVPKSGMVVQADYRAMLHDNGRIYEFDVILYGNAKRVFKKELREFWKSIKIDDG